MMLGRRLHDLSEQSPRLVHLRTRQATPRPLSTFGTESQPPTISPTAISLMQRLAVCYMAAAFPAGLLPIIPPAWLAYFICVWIGLIAMFIAACFGRNKF